MKVLIDTSVIVDVLQSREPFYKNAQKLFLLAANQRFTGYISAKSVTDIYYLSHRLTHDNKKARDILSRLTDIFEIADTTGTDCRRAIPSAVSDYEDAVMIETAVREGMDCIVTRNTRDYSKSGIPVFIPDGLIRFLEKEQETD